MFDFGSFLEERRGSARCSWEALHRHGLTQNPCWSTGLSFRGAWAFYGRVKYKAYVQSKDLFAGITITGCCYKTWKKPTFPSSPDGFTALSGFLFFTMLMVILHLA